MAPAFRIYSLPVIPGTKVADIHIGCLSLCLSIGSFKTNTTMSTLSGSMSGNPQKEVVFDLDSLAFSSDDFRMHAFKVNGLNGVRMSCLQRFVGDHCKAPKATLIILMNQY